MSRSVQRQRVLPTLLAPSSSIPRVLDDVDNLVKLILDALNGVCWEDDSQIDALHVTRALCGDAGPRTVVRVTRVGERMARRAA